MLANAPRIHDEYRKVAALAVARHGGSERREMMLTNYVEGAERALHSFLTRRIERALRAANFSQRDLAKRVNVDPGTVSRWISGDTKMPLAVAFRAGMWLPGDATHADVFRHADALVDVARAEGVRAAMNRYGRPHVPHYQLLTRERFCHLLHLYAYPGWLRPTEERPEDFSRRRQAEFQAARERYRSASELGIFPEDRADPHRVTETELEDINTRYGELYLATRLLLALARN